MEEKEKILIAKGSPRPLGLKETDQGFNIALYFPSAHGITFGLFNEGVLYQEFPLEKKTHLTNGVWHLQIKGAPKDCEYAFKLGKHWIGDPYAKQIARPAQWGKKGQFPLAKLSSLPPFDWQGDKHPEIPDEKLIIYEMHVRGFTRDRSSHTKHPGTFLGMIEKIPYLKKLGINAVELLPIFAFDETANHHINPKTEERLFNYWGYSTDYFFAPMPPYGSVNDFKTLVKALHREGIEVILDVVYNHVGNGAIKSLCKDTFFITDENGHHTNYTGCGNTVYCNHPQVIQFILASLRYWVEEMHVDGFRFDLASIFSRGKKGEILDTPPVIQAINNDPALAKTKLIAEAWDCAGLYQVGSFPGGARWKEWNGKFRDVARRFIKGTDDQSGAFASILTGSQDLYGNGRSPTNSINFIIAHDGFTLRDLVSYNDKHNRANGERNRDGNSHNESWNCGIEGATDDPAILELRERQMKNFALVLGLGIGIPMLYMGDEYGHSRYGNNNPYCQDNQLNYFLWDPIEDSFIQKVIAFRKEKGELFQRTTFLTEADITWHGLNPSTPNWGRENRFVAYALFNEKEAVYVAFNAYFEPVHITLPPTEKKWKRIFDTSLPDPLQEEVENHYYLPSHSALVLANHL